MNIPVIKLKKGKEASVDRFHPWIFSGAIADIGGGIKEGDLVKVISYNGKTLGYGDWQIGSIAVRLLTFDTMVPDEKFFRKRIEEALSLRIALNLKRKDNNIFRAVHGEGDFLPGLIVDIYGDTAVMQAHSPSMHFRRQLLATILTENNIIPLRNIFYKSETTLPFKANLEPHDDYLIKGCENIKNIATENGLKFYIDWLKGQKTGFFVDQRDNRQLVKSLAHNRTVLNMFCYTGGFSVYALSGNAKSVTSVDSSAKAMAVTEENVKLNFGNDCNHIAVTEDAFAYLNNIGEGEYDMIILDPPAFAKHRQAINNALRGYQKLNAKAIEKIRSGGILFTFSCSQAVSKEQFRLAVFSAAAETGRKVRILHQLTQPADHPVNIYHPEGEYLKGLVLYIE